MEALGLSLSTTKERERERQRGGGRRGDRKTKILRFHSRYSESETAGYGLAIRISTNPQLFLMHWSETLC
jgi:hypothetical protein